MSIDLSINAIKSAQDAASGQPARTQVRTRGLDGPKQAVAAGAEPVAARSVSLDPQEILDRAATQAAQDLFRSKDIEVTGVLHKESGRMVYRVTDRESGEVIAQSPAETLLRFYASGRAEAESRLIAIEA